MNDKSVSQKILRVSIVCYAVRTAQLKATLESLLVAGRQSFREGLLDSIEILLVNNGPDELEQEKIESVIRLIQPEVPTGFYFSAVGNGFNLGYGAGHNLTFDPARSDFHLVLNPDVELAFDALSIALRFMKHNKDCGVIAPAILDRNGNRQYLCKRYPTVFDLFMRGFAPNWLRHLLWRRLASYEMRDIVAETVVWNPPVISGCFMLLRSSLLRKIRGFDPEYFLYFEDFDLSLRAGKVCRIAYVPDVKIIHYGGYAARKGMRHIFMFARSAITFFNIHGWKWF